MKIIAITLARFSSSRLPGKVLKKLGSKSVLDLHLAPSEKIDETDFIKIKDRRLLLQKNWN